MNTNTQKNPPRSPFTTYLSGSARETELRIRSIFQWKKKRPPAALMLLVLAAVLLCGNLAACQTESSSGGDVSGPLSQESVWNTLTKAMADSIAVLDHRESLVYTMLSSSYHGEWTLAALSVTDFYPHYVLGIGAVGSDGQLAGSAPFTAVAYGGMPHVTTFQKDGDDYLLYTCNGMSQGLSWGEAGLIRFDGADLTWVWPVEGDIRDAGSQAFADYQTYWEEHLALMAPGGVDVFSFDPGYGPYSGSPQQWVAGHNELFYHAAEETLPTPVYYQVRTWLEEYTRDKDNPWDAINTSASWCVVSLKPADGVYRDKNFAGESVYLLTAQADSDSALYFGAALLFDHDAGAVTGVLQHVLGDYDTVAGRLAEYSGDAGWSPAPVTSLPIPGGEGLELEFCSGAGAWQTDLTLNQDGSFTGVYEDADVDVHYVCSFRGRFGGFQSLSGDTYAMTLEELELTTGRPVGEEWQEGDILYISADPYGLEDGTEFLFYTPEVSTAQLPEEFLLWVNADEKTQLLTDDRPLGRYGLYNETMGYGFFTYEER